MYFKPRPNPRAKEAEALIAKLPQPHISSLFYYDLTKIGVEAMKRAIDAGKGPLKKTQIDCDSFDGENTPKRNFDFLYWIKDAARSGKYKPHWCDLKWERENGHHRADFLVSINIVKILAGKKESDEEVASWNANVDVPFRASCPHSSDTNNNNKCKRTDKAPPFTPLPPDTCPAALDPYN